MCDSKLRVSMCGSKLQCARANRFFETFDVRARGAFLDLQSVIATSHVFKQ